MNVAGILFSLNMMVYLNSLVKCGKRVDLSKLYKDKTQVPKSLLLYLGSISQRVRTRTSPRRYTNCMDSPKLGRVTGPNSR